MTVFEAGFFRVFSELENFSKRSLNPASNADYTAEKVKQNKGFLEVFFEVKNWLLRSVSKGTGMVGQKFVTNVRAFHIFFQSVLLITVCLAVASVVLMTGCAKAAKVEPVSSPPVQKDPFFYHQVKYPGETLAMIAGWYTGNPENWRQIAKVNPGLNANIIKIGDVIRIPQELVIKTDPLPKPRSVTGGRGSAKQDKISDRSENSGATLTQMEKQRETQRSAQKQDSTSQDSTSYMGETVQQKAATSTQGPKSSPQPQAPNIGRKAESSALGTDPQRSAATTTESRFTKDEERERIRKELLKELLQ